MSKTSVQLQIEELRKSQISQGVTIDKLINFINKELHYKLNQFEILIYKEVERRFDGLKENERKEEND